MLIKLRDRSQITIPKSIIEILGIKENDDLNIKIENGEIVISPVVAMAKDQAWFWTDEWQQQEKEVDEDIKFGIIKTTNNFDELVKTLKEGN